MLNLVLSLSRSHTDHWKFNMAPHGKELSEDVKKIIVALHKDGVGQVSSISFRRGPNSADNTKPRATDLYIYIYIYIYIKKIVLLQL